MNASSKAILLSALLIGCGTSSNSPETPAKDTTLEEAVPATDQFSSDGIVGHWWATDVTLNGSKDPEMDPRGKVRWHIAADSSFSMWDNTEGGPDTMSGEWGLAKSGTVFRLIDNEQNEVTQFGILEVGPEVLKLKVLEDAEGEVILHFRRQ